MFRDPINYCLMKVVDTYMTLWPHPIPTAEQLAKTRIVAHRGAWGTEIENTLGAFKKAQRLGAGGVELDIRFTKDNEPVLHHDADLYRIYKNKLLIQDAPLSELHQLGVTSVADIFAHWDGSCELFLELKEALSPGRWNKLSALFQNRSISEKTKIHFMCFTPELIRSFVEPDHKCIAIYEKVPKFSELTKLKPSIITGHYALMSDSFVQRCHNQNWLVGTGFIDSYNVFCREINRSVDYLFTNRVEQLINWKNDLLN